MPQNQQSCSGRSQNNCTPVKPSAPLPRLANLPAQRRQFAGNTMTRKHNEHETQAKPVSLQSEKDAQQQYMSSNPDIRRKEHAFKGQGQGPQCASNRCTTAVGTGQPRITRSRQLPRDKATRARNTAKGNSHVPSPGTCAWQVGPASTCTRQVGHTSPATQTPQHTESINKPKLNPA